MANKFVKFPPEHLAKAQAYLDECNVHYRALVGEPEGVWSTVRLDRNGNHTVALYGPPWIWDTTEVPEPAECAALRVDGVVVDDPEWPVDDI